MARQRITATELARLLNSAKQPIYVLDDEFFVVFCSRACHDWLGRPAEELLGRRCVYHSDPDATGTDATGPGAVAAGLCPPPDAMAGRETTANVSRIGEDGRLVYRRARFVPLGTCPEDLIGVVAIVDCEDLPEPQHVSATPTPPSNEAGPIELHEHIRRFRREAAGRFRANRLIGNSPAIRRARSQIELAAGNRSSVLLIGPRGSGRQHVASAIHYGDEPQSAGSLIPLACSVLGVELIHSTVAALAGGNALGEESARSTLLLEEADQLAAEVQAELACVLVGGSFSLRLVATAEQRLVELARRGKYRQDLACVLSTITIELPPLAERREDLPLLAQLFLEEANAAGTRQLGGFTPEALDLLDAYPWPGNVDELAEVVAQSHKQAEGPEIGVGDLSERIHLWDDVAGRPRPVEERIVLDEFVGRIERELIRRALATAKGNKAKAARLLGMTRPRLYRRLLQLGLEKE